LDKLIEVGAIESFSIRLSMAMTNSEMLVAILTFSESPSEETVNEVLDHPELIQQINRSFDGRYVVFAEYTSPEHLSELTNSFWKIDNITEVETYSNFIIDRGGTMEFSNIHKRVLRSLMKDPRMSITDISEDSGLTPRRISKTINELLESRAVLFTIRWKANVAGETTVFTKVRYDPSKTKPKEFLTWLYTKHQENFNAAFITSLEPILLMFLTVSHFTEMDSLRESIEESGLISSLDSLLIYPGKKYSQPRRKLLEQLLSAGDTK
jgi:DNA-binding Lrp family transcriptional regulator